MAKSVIGKVAILPRGAYNSVTGYKKLDLVTFEGSSYVCLKDCTGVAVTNTEYWQLMAEKGATGQAGANGQNGQDGADGKDGEDGKSAYEIAVDEGFIGTEQEWLASLKGDKGDRGATGPAGTTDYNDLTNKPTIPTNNNQLTNGAGYQTATDVSTAIVTATTNMEVNTNKVTSISSNSTDTQYPSAKCVYDLVGNIESLLSEV